MTQSEETNYGRRREDKMSLEELERERQAMRRGRIVIVCVLIGGGILCAIIALLSRRT